MRIPSVNVRIYRKINDLVVYEDFFLSDEHGETMDIPLFVDEKSKYYAIKITKQGYQTLQIENIEIFAHIHTCIHISMRPLITKDTPAKTIFISCNEKKPYKEKTGEIKSFTFPAYVALSKNHHLVYIDFKTYLKSIANANVNPTWPLDILKSTIYARLCTAFQQVASYDKAQGLIHVLDEKASSLFSWSPSNDVVDKLLCEILKMHQDEWIMPVDDSFHSSIRLMEDIIYHKQSKISSIHSYDTQKTLIGDIQCCLSFLANFYEELPPLCVTYVLDDETKQAIIAFETFTHTQVHASLDTLQTALLSICSKIMHLIDPHDVIPDYPDSLQDISTICMIQRAINTVASMYPAIPNILVDGQINDRCAYAIKVFQELFQMPVSGIMDQSTWNMLFTTASQIERGIHTTQGMPPFPKNPLVLGISGASVLLIQKRLQTISNFYSSIPFIKADACFGVATHQCILAFQDLLGLKKDGVLDHFTWTLIHQVYEEVIRI